MSDNQNEQHAERLEDQLSDLRRMFEELVDNGEASKAASLFKTILGSENALIKERIRAGVYVGQDQINQEFSEFATFIIDTVKPFVTDDAWSIIVDEIRDWVEKRYAKFRV